MTALICVVCPRALSRISSNTAIDCEEPTSRIKVGNQSWQSTYPGPDLAAMSKPLSYHTARPVAAVVLWTRPTPRGVGWPFYGRFDCKHVRFRLTVVGLDRSNGYKSLGRFDDGLYYCPFCSGLCWTRLGRSIIWTVRPNLLLATAECAVGGKDCMVYMTSGCRTSNKTSFRSFRT
jgi:hypothetical protein